MGQSLVHDWVCCQKRSYLSAARQPPALLLQEWVYCPVCEQRSHEKAFDQQVHTITAAALRLQRDCDIQDAPLEAEPRLGGLLRSVDQQHVKSCNSDEGALAMPNSAADLWRGRSEWLRAAAFASIQDAPLEVETG